MRDGHRTRECTRRPGSRPSLRSPPSLDPHCGETTGKEHRHGRTVRSCGGYSVVGVDGHDMRLGRRFPSVEYVAVAELQERGNPHLQVLVRGPFVPRLRLVGARSCQPIDDIGSSLLDVG